MSGDSLNDFSYLKNFDGRSEKGRIVSETFKQNLRGVSETFA